VFSFIKIGFHSKTSSIIIRAGIIDIDNLMELLRIRKALKEHEERTW